MNDLYNRLHKPRGNLIMSLLNIEQMQFELRFKIEIYVSWTIYFSEIYKWFYNNKLTDIAIIGKLVYSLANFIVVVDFNESDSRKSSTHNPKLSTIILSDWAFCFVSEYWSTRIIAYSFYDTIIGVVLSGKN